jgi:hypothetical protein
MARHRLARRLLGHLVREPQRLTRRSRVFDALCPSRQRGCAALGLRIALAEARTWRQVEIATGISGIRFAMAVPQKTP